MSVNVLWAYQGPAQQRASAPQASVECGHALYRSRAPGVGGAPFAYVLVRVSVFRRSPCSGGAPYGPSRIAVMSGAYTFSQRRATRDAAPHPTVQCRAVWRCLSCCSTRRLPYQRLKKRHWPALMGGPGTRNGACQCDAPRRRSWRRRGASGTHRPLFDSGSICTPPAAPLPHPGRQTVSPAVVPPAGTVRGT